MSNSGFGPGRPGAPEGSYGYAYTRSYPGGALPPITGTAPVGPPRSAPSAPRPVTGPVGGGPLPDPLVLPSYGSDSLTGVVPGLLQPAGQRPPWFPAPLAEASQVVLLVLDGLGWLQLAERARTAPALTSLTGGPISTVAPSTTATALTSLSLGLTPAQHGVVGYKFVVDGPSGREVINALRWSTLSGDARHFLPPVAVQSYPAFQGQPVPVVSRSEFAGSGFTQLHQMGAMQVGWHAPSSIPVLVQHLLGQGHPLVYAYYEGLDKMAHATGLGELYGAELAYVDSLVSGLLSVLPPGAALAVTADHGQVDVGDKAVPLRPEVADQAKQISGEARFRWLHAWMGGTEDLLAVTRELYAGEAWVATFDEVVDLGLLGGPVTDEARDRLGDVVMVPLGEHAYLDPTDMGDARLVCRHGGLSREEVLVPFLAAAR